MARQVAVVSQGGDAVVALTVRDLVSMGRYPYVGRWGPLRTEDHEAVEACLELVDLAESAERDVRGLSGGELQRARLARALVQEPRLLLLDEPTAHLDLGHEARFMELVKQYTDKQSVTVVAVTHHLNVAARFADRMVLLAGGRVIENGRPEEVLAPPLLEQAFDWPVRLSTWETSAAMPSRVGPPRAPTREPGGTRSPSGSTPGTIGAARAHGRVRRSRHRRSECHRPGIRTQRVPGRGASRLGGRRQRRRSDARGNAVGRAPRNLGFLHREGLGWRHCIPRATAGT